MICNTAYALLAVGLVSQALAEPFGGPEFARMSTRDILGLQRRAIEGYAPTEQLCGSGDTCAEACGKGFRQCASTDGLTHCYNRTKKQTCCPGGTGDSCDNGYYCSADEHEKTWCCPDGLTLAECAKKYDIPGPLTSESPSTSTTKTKTKTTTTKAKPTTTKETTTTSKAEHSTTSTKIKEPTTTSTKSRKPETTKTTSTTSKTKHRTTTSSSTSEETSTSTPTPTPTSTTSQLIDLTSLLLPTDAVAGTQVTALGSDAPSTPATTAAPSSTSSVDQSGSSRHEPVNGLILFIAGAMAALI